MKQVFSLVVVIVVIAGFFIWLYGVATDSNQQDPEATLLPQQESPDGQAIPQGKRMILSEDGFLPVADITIDPVKSYEGDVIVFAENDDFSIIYYAQNDQFLITLKQKGNYAFARAYAEETFLEKLEITQTQACSLAVDVVIPPYIDFDFAGSYGLSFCPGALDVP